MPRPICPNCQRLLKLCLCDAIRPVANQQALWILQHPSEQGHAKNTASLADLALNNSTLLVGETEQDFKQLAEQVAQQPQSFVLIYPNPHSQELSQLGKLSSSTLPRQLVFIDATWRKAYKLWALNPWLQQLSSYHLALEQAGNYRIRKAKLEHSLSTLEAIAHTLEQTEHLDAAPLLKLQDAFVEQQLAQVPAELRSRY